MPCVTYETEQERRERAERARQDITGPLHEEIDCLKAELNEREAMLCAVLTCLETDGSGEDVLAHLNEKEAGVTLGQIEAWFIEHKEKDRHRREAEKMIDELKKRAILARLTEEERRILGV
jgi:hypothetical protein